MKTKFFFTFFLLVVMSACNRQDGVCSFKDIEFITEANTEYIELQPESSEIVDLGLMSVVGLRVYGPYMIVASREQNGLLKVLEREPPYRLLGSFFHQGNGPGELTNPELPSIYGQDQKGNYYAEFDDRAGKLIRFNITESIDSGVTVYEIVGSTKRQFLSSIPLGEAGLFVKEVSADRDAQIRYILKDDEQIVPPNMERLNSAVLKNKVDDGFRFNVLSGGIWYDSSNSRIIETSSQLNTIHMYSIDGKYGKTYCIGDKLYNYNEIADMEMMDRPLTCSTAIIYDDIIAVLYLDVPMGQLYQNKVSPSVLLIPRSGKGRVRRIFLPDPATSFELDMESKKLYTLSIVSETVRAYDISEWF